MFAEQFLKRLEEQGLLDEALVAEIRRQIEEADHRVSPEVIAKFLVDNGHLTRYQAVKLIGEVTALPTKEELARRRSRQEAARGDAAQEPPRTGREDRRARPAPPANDAPADEESDEGESEIVSLEENGELGLLEEADDVVQLEDAGGAVPLEVVEDVLPLERARKTKTPANVVLTPLDLLPDDPLFGGGAGDWSDPLGLGQPPGAAVSPPLAGARAARRPIRINPWDSKLLLVGGAVFLLLAAALIALYTALTRGSASEMFQLAEDDYRAQAYAPAITKYERFVKGFPKDVNASLARVRRGTARLRLDMEVSSNPAKALATAREVLPQIETEAAFDEARAELTSLLPDIAEGFAKLALKAEQAKEKQRYIDLTNQAMGLVNNAAYIPTSLRRTQETRIAAILADVARVQRDIDCEKDRDQAIRDMNEAVAAKETARAYDLRKTLLKKYPALETDELLQKATSAITAKQRDLTIVENQGLASVRDDSPRSAKHVVTLANRQGEAIGGVDQQQRAFVLARGAAYGLSAATGRVLWRRFVGYEAGFQPIAISDQSGADAMLADLRRNEVIRVEGATGKLVWRLPVGEPFADIVVAAGRILVSTRTGRILEPDPRTGDCKRWARLPQALQVGVCVGEKQPQFYQLGDHSNLYVLSQETLQCGEVYYLGHKSGTIATPPVMLQGHLFIAENAGSDYALLHVIAPDPSGLSLKRPRGQEPIRLRGNVIVPPQLFGRRLLVATDRDALYVFDVDAAGQPPVTRVGKLEAAASSPVISYPLVDGARLWVADRRFSRFQIQLARGQLDRQWVKDDGDDFLAPLQRFGDSILHVRRRKGGSGATVSAVQGEDGARVWQTDLGAAAGALKADAQHNRIVAISAGGALYEITQSVLAEGLAEQPIASVAGAGQAFSFSDPTELGDGRLVLSNPADRGQLLLYDPKDAARPLRLVQLKIPAGTNGGAPTPFAGGLLVPLDNGEVAVLDAGSGDQLMHPFQPPWEAGAKIAWRRPAVLGPERREFVIADDQSHVYRVGVKDDPQRHLSELSRAPSALQLLGALAAAGETIYGVVPGPGGDIVVSLKASDLSLGPEWPLQGRVVWGPQTADAFVFVASDSDGLLCLDGGAKQRWATPLPYGPLAGPPLRWEKDWILASATGVVWRIDGETGKELAKSAVGEPLGAGPAAFDGGPLLPRGSLLLSGADGAIHVLDPLSPP